MICLYCIVTFVYMDITPTQLLFVEESEWFVWSNQINFLVSSVQLNLIYPNNFEYLYFRWTDVSLQLEAFGRGT